MTFRKISLLGAAGMVLCLSHGVMAQEATPSAEIVNDQGGAATLSGEMAYTYEFLTTGVTQPVIFLDDLTGYADLTRTEPYVRSPESQTFGVFTSDLENSPVGYSLSLPIEPHAPLNDVDGDDETDAGLQLFSVAFRLNVYGDTTLDARDFEYTFGSWVTYASTRLSQDFETKYDINGGKIILYAPDDAQAFPSGLGADGILFSDDDAPAVRVPQGWTVVDLDSEPFTFDRSRTPTIDLYEPAIFESPDYSDLSYTEAFDTLTDAMRLNYAFTDLKQIDWDALVAEFRPRIVQAEADGDSFAYQLALRDFNWSIPDGHVYIDTPALNDLFFDETSGGLGFAMRELDDGRVLVTYVLEAGPAAAAGIETHAEILAINGESIDDAVSAVVPWSSPFSNAASLRLQQLRYALRFPVDTEVEIRYQNPGASAPATVTLTTVAERASFSFSSQSSGIQGDELPVEYQVLENGYGYVRVYDFTSDFILTIKLWEYMLENLNANNVPGLIIDMRQNGGGEGYLAEGMAAYFFNEALNIGSTEFYTPGIGYTAHPRDIAYFQIAPEHYRYAGPVAVLVGPGCASACEVFAADMTLQDRAAIVGNYPTAGLGGYINSLTLPEGLYMQYTQGQGVGPDGEINIEGTGVVPTIDVPVTEYSLFSQEDGLIEAAVGYLNEATARP